MNWKTMAVESGSENLCCNHTRQFLHQHWCLNFERCDERHHVELISNSLGAQTVALGVPTQGAGRKQAVNRSEQCRSSMEATWRPPLKGFCDWSEPGSVLLSLPRNRVVAMRAKEEQPRAPPASRVLESGVRSNNQEGGSSSGSAMPASDSPPLDKRVCDKKNMTGAPVKEQGVPKRRQEQPTVPEAAESTQQQQQQ